MKPDDVANAITQALVQGGSQWLVWPDWWLLLPAMWTMALILHIGRPYVVRTLRRCGVPAVGDLVDVVPADARWRIARYPWHEPDLLRTCPRGKRRIPDHWTARHALPVASARGEAFPSGRR